MAVMLAEVEDLGERAAKLAGGSLRPLADSELTELLQAAHRLEQAAAVLQTRIVRQAADRGLPTGHGCRSTAGWVRSVLLIDPKPAREMTALATALRRSPAVEQALIDGHVDLRQAAVIAATVETISAELAACDETDTAQVVRQAEQTMIDMCGRLPAYQLRQVGERILAHVAPDLADRVDEAILARQEARAHLRRGLTLSLPVNGMVRVSGTLGAEDAAIVQAALHPLCQPTPAHPDDCASARGDDPATRPDTPGPDRPAAHAAGRFPTGSDDHRRPRDGGPDPSRPAGSAQARSHPDKPSDERTPAQRRADALIDICRLTLRSGRLPADGGEPPQLAVTVAYDPLARSLGRAVTDTGHRLSAASARRLACDARLLPLVLGGESQILDAGRTRRLATGSLRRALAVRDRGCAFPDCDRPPRWTDAHHLKSWTAGGPTSLDNTALLCRPHHRLIHDPAGGWRIRLGADRHPEFIPPPWIDPHQRPRRNLYHHRQ